MVSTTGPYARMVNNRFDLTPYCQRALVDSLDRLTSVKFALFSLVRPALKIAARSLFIENEEINISNILSHLNSNTPVTSPPPEAPPQRPKRSFGQRIIHFFTVGIPLAILVGLIAGVMHFVKSVSQDLLTVFTIGSEMYRMARFDGQYYKQNPQELPSRNVAFDAVINQVVIFYTSRLIYKKLGIFHFLAKPLIFLLERVLKNRVATFFDTIDRLRGRNVAAGAQYQS
ncbi:unnamed protein product [Didymodactylos carnosus]|uniref:Uncharacterized protein n=1 Tax=Didymodactylos carnosus TaxID=1234261 RepID=A0A813YIQ7_9BILA|nr:unnamed protein product [Didymodactylos carnosus]CAF0884863.1 unnamed protein product [Didymodactylos carnosus]CAF3512658.1 unnamed protein product [Didymodactylos carnosus]CAF3670311.1 unnamed protein product [Didymodactylos carnosus]